MGERRKRKSMWDMEEETKQFSGMSEHNSGNDSGHYHELPASRTFTAPKSRDHSGRPLREPNEENPVAQVNGSFIESKHNSPEGKEISGQNRYYQNMCPGSDGTERRKYMRPLKNDRSDFYRHPRSDPSRSPSNSRSNGSPKDRTRSQSPIPDYRNQSHKSSDGRSVPDKSSRASRDFSAGRSPRGGQCRIVHYSHNSFHGKVSYSKVTRPDLGDDISDFYRGGDEQLQNRSRNAVPCREFMKGKCRWGDSCRFLHHFASDAKNDNRLGSGMEYENVSWRIPESEDIGVAETIDERNMSNKQENLTLHGLQLQNQDGSSNFQGQINISRQDHCVAEKNVATSFCTDVLGEAKDSRSPMSPIPFSGQNLNRNGEDVLPGQYFASNATDDGLDMVWPNPLNGCSGELNRPEVQLGACLDLHPQMHNHPEAIPTTGVLEKKVTSVTSPSVFLTPTFDNVLFRENADTPLSVVDAKPDNAEVDNSGSSKLKQETVLANSEVGEGNKAIVDENKGYEKITLSQTLDGHKKVDDSIGQKDEKVARLFKNSLIEFVKEILKPTWKEGRLSRDAHKAIVKKVVDKITSAVQADHIPKTHEKIDQYLSFSKPKIAKLVQAYVERSLKTTDS